MKVDGCHSNSHVKAITSFEVGIFWWTDLLTIIYYKLSDKATFETDIEWFLLTENIESPELMPFDAVVK